MYPGLLRRRCRRLGGRRVVGAAVLLVEELEDIAVSEVQGAGHFPEGNPRSLEEEADLAGVGRLESSELREEGDDVQEGPVELHDELRAVAVRAFDAHLDLTLAMEPLVLLLVLLDAAPFLFPWLHSHVTAAQGSLAPAPGKEGVERHRNHVSEAKEIRNRAHLGPSPIR